MGSRVWIPLEYRKPGAAWVDVNGDDCTQCYVNDEAYAAGVRCRDCGSTLILWTFVEDSEKSMISKFCDRHGLRDISYDLSGAREGDKICTCLSCGANEEGSPSFGMLEVIE